MKNKLKISILTPSLNAENILQAHSEWFLSLNNPSIELILIDQNEKNNESLVSLGQNYPQVKYIHNPIRGLSLNRNLGAEYCEGEYIFLLDDDARLTKDMLSNIIEHLNIKKPDILLCSIVDEQNHLTSYTPSNKSKAINILNIEGHVNSNGILAKNELLIKHLFDIDMGVGAKYGACEEIDFVVRCLIDNAAVFYEPHFRVVHPPKPYDKNKSYNYGMGHGYFAKKLILNYTGHNSKILGVKKICKCLAKKIVSFGQQGNKSTLLKYWVSGFVQGIKR